MFRDVFRHVDFFRIMTHKGLEVFQLLVQSDDMGLDGLLRHNIRSLSAFDVIDPSNTCTNRVNQIVICDWRRSYRRGNDTLPDTKKAPPATLALIEPERCNRQDVYKSGFSDFLSWPVLAQELSMRLLSLCRSLSLNDPHYIYSRVALVERCCTYLAENIAQATSVHSLARLLNTNHNTLNTLFKREMGLPPSAWQRKMRMEGAASQLMTTDLPISVIAERFGYELASNFATAFRRHFEMTPQRYRRVKSQDHP